MYRRISIPDQIPWRYPELSEVDLLVEISISIQAGGEY